MFRNISCEKGFTLIEILIALTIFSVGLLAIAGLQISAIKHNSSSNLRTSTTALAQGVMEQVMSLPRDDRRFTIDGTYPADNNPSLDTVFPSDIDPNNSDNDGDPATLRLPSAGSFTASWDVLTDDPVAHVSTITVTVQEASGREVSLTSFKHF